jgi:hypothetical protein
LIGNDPSSADPVSLSDLANRIDAAEGSSVVQTIDTPGSPPVLVVDLPDADAAELQNEFAGRLTIEEDATLGF